MGFLEGTHVSWVLEGQPSFKTDPDGKHNSKSYLQIDGLWLCSF